MSVSFLLTHQSFSAYPPTFSTITTSLSTREMAFEAIITIIPSTRYCGFQTSRFEVLYTAPLELPISLVHKVSQVLLGSSPY